MNSIRKFCFIFIIFLSTPTFVSASGASFTTLSPVDIGGNSVYLRGEFNARDKDMSNAFYVWFQYGKGPDELFNRTRKITLRVKNSIQSEQLTNLDENTHYYYRTVLKDGLDIRYSHVLDFITLEKNIQDTIKEDEPKEISNHKPFSFYEIFRWRTKKEKTIEQPPKEIEENNNIESIDEDKSLNTEKHYNNSAAYDDELGEVIEFNKKNTTFKNKKTQKSRTLNYPILLFFIVLLGVALVLIRLVLLKKKRKIQYNKVPQRANANKEQGRYYIPVKRDLHDPKQNPNKFFAEKNSRDK